MQGAVAQVWRYPVKSMQGETPDVLDLDGDRVPLDREWGVRDSTTGRVLTGRGEPRLLLASARVVDGDRVCITLPDGRQLHEDDYATDLALSSYVGRPVHLARAKADEHQGFAEDGAQWQSRAGSFNDGHPVHLLTTATLAAGPWDARRFRPNVVLDVGAGAEPFAEEGWTSVRLGNVALEIYKRTTRCSITTRAQPGLAEDPEVRAELIRNRNAKLGVYARVTTPGPIAAGDAVQPT
jgi:uncharacterized protein YcbX